MAPRTQDIDPAILDFMIATNQYGTGPGYESTDYTAPAKRLNYWQDILYNANIDLDDILGVAPEPEDPGVAPTYEGFQNDLRTTYGSNPVLAQAFAEIEDGADPFKTAAGIMSEVDAGNVDAQYLPTSQAQGFGGGVETSQQDIEELLTSYAANREREMADMADYQRQLQEHQSQADEFQVYNNPTSEFELRGSPDFASDLGNLKGQVRAQDRRGPSMADQRQQSEEPGLLNRWGRQAVDRAQQGSRINPGDLARSAVQSVRQQAPTVSREGSQMLGRMAHYQRGRQQRNIRPSGRELDNRKRLQAIYMLQNGELL